MIQFRPIVDRLVSAGADFIIIGGVAASLHGSSQATFDIDLCYARRPDNLEKLGRILTEIHATLRGAPSGLPFKPDAETLRHGLNFTFDTDLGKIDLLGEVAGIGAYEQIIRGAEKVDFFGYRCAILSIPQLISAKRASGRPKDLIVLPELEAILESQLLNNPDKEDKSVT
ncbi:MAG: hypothetical protein KF868_10435 [Acidobacteria bacterium]|nr:hypothetical protein [Acidobacteriota bacterium]MCW5969898.1 hypothetical protein [Blastocatellales bacterium]